MKSISPIQTQTLMMHITLVGDFFFTASHVVYELPKQDHYPTYVQLMGQLIWPHLTEMGQQLLKDQLGFVIK